MMMNMKRKKAIGMRGSRTHGYGSHKKHRGSGSRGGCGFAGSLKHMKLWVRKHHPERLEKQRYKSLVQKGLRPMPTAINLRDISRLAAQSQAMAVNVAELGYDKVLGAGTIPPGLTVTARSFSKKAEEKIGRAGGKAVKQ